MATIQEFNEAIEYAPRIPRSPVSQGLVGWKLPDGKEVCACCAARVIDRGCSHVLRQANPVWSPEVVLCESKLHTF